jgi:hypothetical protein
MQAGIFQLIVSAYNDAAEQITARSREGQQRMTEVAEVLRTVAGTYDEEERNGEHAFRNLY